MADTVPVTPTGDDSPLAAQARRLALSAALTRRAARVLGAETLPDDASPAALIELATGLAGHAAAEQRAHRVLLTPAYPGLTGGVERVGTAARLVLACTAVDQGGDELGVVFTSLIAGRPPYVAVAPPGAPIPQGWAPLA